MAFREADGEKSSGRGETLRNAGSTLLPALELPRSKPVSYPVEKPACGASPNPGVPAAVSIGGGSGLPDLARDGRAFGVLSLGGLAVDFADALDLNRRLDLVVRAI